MIDTQLIEGPIKTFEHRFDDEHGAQCVFMGRVRRHNVGKTVIAIEYDSFKPLAEKVFQQLAYEVKRDYGQDAFIQIHHAQGRLQVGEVSVRISVATRHRDESFKACRYIIEQIKKRAPIWKKEFYTDSESVWVQGHALCQHHHGDVHAP